MENKEFKIEQVSVRLAKETPLYSEERVRTPNDAVRIIGKELMTEFDREQMLIINLDSAARPVNFAIVSVGTINKSLAEPRELLKTSILSNAASTIVLHNHPTGNVLPSRDDIETTKRLIAAYKILGINLVDHVIIGGNNAEKIYSMREADIVDFDKYMPEMTGELKFAPMSDIINEKIGVFLVAEELGYWVNTNYTTIYLTNEEAELMLEYADRDGFNLGVKEGKFVKINPDTEETYAFSPEDAIYRMCDLNEKLITKTEENVHKASNFMNLCEAKKELKDLRKEEDIIEKMFRKTSLGKVMELGRTKETDKEQKEWMK